MRTNSARTLKLCALLIIPIIAGCGGGGGDGGTPSSPQEINKPPVLSVMAPSLNPAAMDVNVSNSLDIRFKAEDPNDKELQYIVTWDAGSVSPVQGKLASGTEGVVKFTAPERNGRCTVTLSVTDGKDTVSKDVQIDIVGVVPPEQPKPIVQSISMFPSQIKPGDTATLTAVVQNPGGKPLTYTWTSQQGTIKGSGTTATWKAPQTSGQYAIYLKVSDGTNNVQAGYTAYVLSEDRTGLLGRYFKTYRKKNIVGFDYEAFRRTDPNVNFNWGKGSPDETKLYPDGWGAQWTGFVKCEQPGTYFFRVFVDDGAYLRVMNDAGQWVDIVPNTPENWTDHVEGAWLPATPFPLTLEGGKWYPIELTYFEGGGDAVCKLYWSVGGGAEEIVPPEVFRLPVEQ